MSIFLAITSLCATAQDTVDTVLRPPKGAQLAIVIFEDLECPMCRRTAPLVEQAEGEPALPCVPSSAMLHARATPSIGAVVQRTRTPGLVEGEPGGGVRFKFMARDGAGVTPGDLVVTSGLGTLFPKGIPVGRVTAIEDKGSALFHFAILAPAVDFSRVEEVLLVTGQTTQDVATLFPTEG